MEWWGTFIGIALVTYAIAILRGNPRATRLRGGSQMSEGEQRIFAAVGAIVGVLIVIFAWTATP